MINLYCTLQLRSTDSEEMVDVVLGSGCRDLRQLLPDLVAINALCAAVATSGRWLLVLRLMDDATMMRMQCDAITGCHGPRADHVRIMCGSCVLRCLPGSRRSLVAHDIG